LKVLDEFRRLIASVHSLDQTLKSLVVAANLKGPAMDRLDSLEADRIHFEATCEGLLLKAEGKLRAANNAEARERNMKASYEKNLDPFAEDSEEVQAAIRPEYVEAIPEEGVSPMHLGLAHNDKSHALNAKFQ